jgi:hypothetical protein
MARARVTPLGLEIEGVTQVFNWERSVQQRFAAYAAEGASHIVNIGYGLGFAQEIFEQKRKVQVDLVEVNEYLAHEAKRRSKENMLTVHLGRWEDKLTPLLDNNTTIYFDAFPVGGTFSYSPSEFRFYINPFLKLLAKTTWRSAFFIVFDSCPIIFPISARLKVRRILSLPFHGVVPVAKLTRMSLYEVQKSSAQSLVS